MFRKLFHPDQTESGLVPPSSPKPVWKEPDPTPVKLPSWKPEQKNPTEPTLEERKTSAYNEALVYLQEADRHANRSLSCVLMLRWNITRATADAIVRQASETLNQGDL